MAIRFLCPSCSQPIEVDDDLASKAVACPYCRKTITAPPASTFTDSADVPVAAPMRMSPPAGLPGYPPPAQPGGNRLAVVAFGSACAVVVMFILSSIVLSNHQVEFEEFTKAMTQSGGGFAGQVKAMSEFVEERGGVLPRWLYVLILLSMGAIGLCVASLVCALFAIRRPAKRGYSVAALVICTLFLLANCAGMLAGP